MCGRFVFFVKQKQFLKQFQTDWEEELGWEPHYNVAPGMKIPVVLQNKAQHRIVFLLKWGLIPFWAKKPALGVKMINARSETLLEKPAYKEPFTQRRCIIPANGFYEWKKIDSRTKQPFYFSPNTDDYFGFAGVYDKWYLPNGKVIPSCSLITTTPNSLVEEVHSRMPVILSPSNYATWLSSEEKIQTLQSLLKPFPVEEMQAYPISTRVGNIRNNEESLIQPLFNIPREI